MVTCLVYLFTRLLVYSFTCLLYRLYYLEFSGCALINHIGSHHEDNDAEDAAQESYVEPLEQFCARERTEE